MRPVAVATDSTHYLPRSLADREGIHQVSLYVGWQEGRERELEMDSFYGLYERLRSDPELPTTSQPSIGDFLAVWEPLIEAGRDVVSIHLAGCISGTYEAACQGYALLAERGQGVRADGQLRAGAARQRCGRVGGAAHPGARPGAAADRSRARDLRRRAGLHIRGRTRHRHLHGTRPDRRGRGAAHAARVRVGP